MTALTPILLFINALVAIAMVILILLQRTDGNSGGMFGGTGSNQPVVRNPLAKPTAILAAVFLVNCLLLAYAGSKGHTVQSIMDQPTAVPVATTPAQALPQPGQTTATPAPAEVPAVTPEAPVSPTL